MSGVFGGGAGGGGGGLTDGDKGDVTVTGGGATWNVDPGTVGATEAAATLATQAELDAVAAAASAEVAALDALAVDAPLSLDPTPPANTQVIQALGIPAIKEVFALGNAVASTTAEVAPFTTASWAASAWTRSGANIEITRAAHGLTTGDRVNVTVTSDALGLPLGWYAVDSITDANRFVVTGLAAGGPGTATVEPNNRFVFPANTLDIGDVVRVRAWGSMTQNAAAGFTVRLRVNGTFSTAFSALLPAASLPDNAATRGWVFAAEWRVSSTPGLVGSATLIVNSYTAAADEFTITRRAAGATALTLTSPLYFDLTIQPNVSSAAAVMTPEGMFVWQAKAPA